LTPEAADHHPYGAPPVTYFTATSQIEGGDMNVRLFVIRVIVGVLFVGHGAQEARRQVRRVRADATGSFFESLELRPGCVMVFVSP